MNDQEHHDALAESSPSIHQDDLNLDTSSTQDSDNVIDQVDHEYSADHVESLS